jgi:transaldolase
MPEATLLAVADHGVVTGDTIRSTYADSRHVLDELAAVGVDYDSVVADLEERGIATFQTAWAGAAAQLGDRMAAAAR